MSMGRQEAFEIFKRDYQGNEDIEEQKKFLKKSYVEAKLLGELINTARNKLNTLKAKGDELFSNGLEREYESLRKTMEYEKENYRLNFEKLKNLKTQIEHAQHLIEKSQVKLQKDFENWWQEQCEIIDQKRKQNEENERSLLNSNGRVDSASRVDSSVSTVTASTIPSANSLLSSVNNSYQNNRNDSFDYSITSNSRLPQLDQENSKNSISRHNSGIILTGDSQIDADITAFINARKRVTNQINKRN